MISILQFECLLNFYNQRIFARQSFEKILMIYRTVNSFCFGAHLISLEKLLQLSKHYRHLKKTIIKQYNYRIK